MEVSGSHKTKRCNISRRIDEDWKAFRDAVSGRVRKSLKRLISRGTIVHQRPKNGKIEVPIEKIDIPQITFGEGDEGFGRGEGKDGEVIGKSDKGKGSDKAGQGEKEGMIVSVELEDVLKFLQNELKLPNLKHKPDEIFEEIKIKYNNISLVGPESLRHNKRTFLEALKRTAASGNAQKKRKVPGLKAEVPIIEPIPKDKRYRQYKEIKLPSSNALIIFARDGSGSMTDDKCDVINDMAWWIDVWIRRFYEKVERLYVWHDQIAEEVDEDRFYRYRAGGGTYCSSALKFIDKQFENRYPPNKWNIYVFYFTDGENWGDDNNTFIEVLKEKFTPEVVNFVGITQIASNYSGSVKYHVDEAINSGFLNSEYVKTAAITSTSNEEQIIEAIKLLLGAKTE
jgi:uncharacterized sporulation protein YeaH/YhbH (DUF444 family)